MVIPYDPDTPFCIAGAQYMLAQCRKAAKHLPGARLAEDPEELHDVRVAIRRLLTAMLVFRPCFEASEYRLWYKDLSRLSRAVAEVRDFDIQIGLIRRITGNPVLERNEAGYSLLAERIASRSLALKKMTAVIDRWEREGHLDRLRQTLLEVLQAAGMPTPAMDASGGTHV